MDNQINNLYWQLPSVESKFRGHITLEKLGKNIKRVFRKYKYIEYFGKLLSKDDEECAEEFLLKFFLDGFDEKINVKLANLSLRDNSDKRISLSIRIPCHNDLNGDELLPHNVAVAIIGYCPTARRNPIFIPEKVTLTHGQFEATSYEAEIGINFNYLAENQYPPNQSQNILSSTTFLESLPKYAVETGKRLKEWQDFLKFKEKLIKDKAEGLRYLNWRFNEDTEQLEFLVIAKDKDFLKKVTRTFNRQNLQAFDIKVSEDEYYFNLPQKEGDRIQSAFRDLGQTNNKSLKIIDDNNPDKKLVETCKQYRKNLAKEEKDKTNFNFEKAIFAFLHVDLLEDASNKIAQFEDDVNEDSSEWQSRSDKINNFFRNIPQGGFLAISLVGDLALLDRHKRAVSNLRQNEGCYAPYLSNYLFDINNANEPNNIEEIKEWENNNLNDNQKLAVQKMLSAPDICLIQGPPGTGKTTVIAEACLQFAKRGETVLLASQAHDALDNALSRLENNPNLRAIRLAKDESRITDDGKEFTGINVLEKQYTALKNYVVDEYLKPQENLNEEIKKVDTWLKNAEFINSDLKQLRNQYAEIDISLKELKIQLKDRKKQFLRDKENYQNSTKTKEDIHYLIQFLEGTRQDLPQSNNPLPKVCHELVKILCNLPITIKIKQDFSYNDFLSSPPYQTKILETLFKNWQLLVNHLPQISIDLNRLNEMEDGKILDVETKFKINELKQEISQLQKRLDNDEDNLFTEWKDKRKELINLQNTTTNYLTGEYYQLFDDGDKFIKNEDLNELKELLKERLNILQTQKNHIEAITNNLINELNKLHKQLNPIQPNEEILEQFRNQHASLQRKLDEITNKGKSKNQDAEKLLQSIDLNNYHKKELENENIVKEKFDNIIKQQSQKLNNLQHELEAITNNNKEFQPLFDLWTDILSDPLKRAKADWNDLKAPYIKSCNLVAISCNENERTLNDAGFDGFDVVIIDEVSKATPLELLLPLMRGKKAILVGDHRQLPPIFNESDGFTFEEEVEQNEELDDNERQTNLTKDNFKKFEKMVTASLFKELFENAPDSLRQRLDIQFRMHPDIMRMINFFYEGRLSCGNPDLVREHNIEFKSKNNVLLKKEDHVLWIDTTDDENDKHYSINQNTSNINQMEARLIAKTLVDMNRQAEKQGYNKKNKLKVGVVSFYQPQCRTIRDEIRKINNRKLRFNALDVEINTVIRYQGKEKPIILLSLVKNNGKDKSQKFRAGRANIARFEFINVAMSRAQNLLLVFGARNMLENREVRLPRMDRNGYDNKMVYKNMFNYLEYRAESGSICTASEFAKTISTEKN